MKDSKWGALLTYMTGLVNQEFFCRTSTGCEESHFASTLAGPITVVRSGEIHARRDRQATRAESFGAGRLRSQARHDSCLVPQADCPQVRWIQTPDLSW